MSDEKIVENEKVKVKKRTFVSDVDFVIAYRDSKSYREMAEKLGMKEQSARQRAKNLKKLGVPFKPFPRQKSGRKALDINELISLLNEPSV